jgi:hypothetical protein
VAGQLLQVVSSKVKGLEAGELAEFGGQPGQAVVADLK